MTLDRVDICDPTRLTAAGRQQNAHDLVLWPNRLLTGVYLFRVIFMVTPRAWGKL